MVKRKIATKDTVEAIKTSTIAALAASGLTPKQ
jgi:hypothetical protein